MKKNIETKEFSLITAISEESYRTQRQLSESTGLSLGMTNILIKKLINKGYIKVKHLDWKRTQYLLTMKGMMEISRKSFAYALHTLKQFRVIRAGIEEKILAEKKLGAKRAYLIAWPEYQGALSEAFTELGIDDFEIEFVETFNLLGDREGLIFAATVENIPKAKPGQKIVPLINSKDLKFQFDS